MKVQVHACIQTPLRPYTTGSATLTTTLTYLPGANGSKTGMIASYRNGTEDAYTYTYDANGNIVSITKGSMSFTYAYDAANQLVRENLQFDSKILDYTCTYEYDEWGNILNKKKYAYTTGTLGAVLNTVTYSYTDSQWGDLLTSYNGQTITYDAMGNPTAYRGAVMSWEEKRLISYTKGTNTVTYSYDENGLRLNKTVNGTVTEYYYNGSVLIGMYIAADNVKLRFSYDALGNVVAVDYSEDGGTNYTTYYYLRNAQNDIVKIVDSTGTTVVEYIYDSWGKLISSAGSLANTVGTYQPFRYRGYVCDDDLGLYYLQSRYYDPTICRFISADVYLSTGQGVLGHNSFAYCLNTPINGFDPDGHSLNPFCNLVADGTGCGGSWTACYGGGAITIVVCGHKVTINANILLIAPDGYDEQFIESAIKKYYEGVFYGDDDYFDVSVNLTFFSPETQSDDSIVIKIIDDCGTSYTHGKYLKNHWQLNKIGLIVAYTHWSNGELKNDFDWTIAHEFTHALNIPDQRDSNFYLFGGSTIMESRGGLMTYKVIKLIIKTFKTNRGYGWE